MTKSGGDESTIGLQRMSDFNNIINIKGHKNDVNSIDIQENGGFSVFGGEIKLLLFLI